MGTHTEFGARQVKDLIGKVSIQLVSPASGDNINPKCLLAFKKALKVSIQLVSPASGDLIFNRDIQEHMEFPFN